MWSTSGSIYGSWKAVLPILITDDKHAFSPNFAFDFTNWNVINLQLLHTVVLEN